MEDEQEEHEKLALDLREKLAQIDQLLADRDRIRQETRYAGWTAALALLAAGAGIFGAGELFIKYVLEWTR